MLTAAVSVRLSSFHPAVTAQRLLLQTISTGTAEFGIYADDPQPALTALSDVRALAGRILSSATPEQLAEVLPADLLAAYAELLSLPKDHDLANHSGRLGWMAPPSAIATAVGLTAAVHILNHRGIRETGHAMRWLIPIHRQASGQVSPSTMADWGIGTSTLFRSAQLAAIGPMLRPSDQLRHRVASARPDTLEVVSARALRRSRTVPSMFWPAWSLRISPEEGSLLRFMRPALSCALLVVGNRLEYSDVSRDLGAAVSTTNITRFVQKLQADPDWPDILAALTRLADYLDEQPAPIDYSRRRRLDYTGILPDADWRRICRRAALLPGNGVRIRLARCLLFERLSGLPADLAPPAFAITDPTSRAKLADFTTQLVPDLGSELDRVADQFLQTNSIREPVSWQPPMELLKGLDLPGADPESIDLKRMHDLIRSQGLAPARAAESLGTTIETVRYLMECHPAAPPPMTVQQARTVGSYRRWAGTVLSADEFARLYEQEGLSLRQIAAKYGLGRRVATTLARDFGIIIRSPGGVPRVVISRDWLYDQYVNQQRTLTELAQETGVSVSVMCRWATRLKIPTRPADGSSHSVALRIAKQATTCPPMLRRVLTGPGAWRRLDRFAAIAAYPSMRAGAAALGINYTGLVTQINRIERELEGPVFLRGNHGHPMELTDLGRQLLSTIAQSQALRRSDPQA